MAEETWVVLSHTPGPAAPVSGSLFEDERFVLHVAFLRSMREKGFLVAAGPLSDTEASGMTVLRLPGGGRFEEAERIAREDDGGVTSGLLDVRVRPWGVVMHAMGDG